jgi:hypothetical protein
MADEGPEAGGQFGACGQILFDAHPRLRPTVQIPVLEVFLLNIAFIAMELITILNRCYPHRGFVYETARFGPDKKTIEIKVRPRQGTAAVCSGCYQPAPGYDHLSERSFGFIPLRGFLVVFLCTMRRVNCRRCGAVVVEQVPWGDGKRSLTKAYRLFLARWARRFSWQGTAEAFRTSWDKVFDAVEDVVTWGLEHRQLGQIDAVGVDEIQYASPTLAMCVVVLLTPQRAQA